MTERAALRRQLLAARAALPPAARERAARRITALIACQPWLRRGRAVSIYVATGAETPTAALARLADARGCRVYAPHITSFSARLMTMALDEGLPLRPNRHGIGEPPLRRCLSAASFDVVFVPLLGFSRERHRLGYGAGYYDRWLAGCDPHRTLKVGIGLELGRLPALPALPTDIALDVIVTEAGLHR